MEKDGTITKPIGLKIIVIIGPESTGKSTLCKQLSTQYNCDYLPEFSRAYLEGFTQEYSYEDILIMAKGQLKSEKVFSPNAPFAFIDTNLLIYKVWIEEKYQLTIDWIEEEILQSKVDHYFLCDIDIPWEEDPLREHPDENDRKRLFDRYHELVMKTGVPYIILHGNEDQRLLEVLSYLNEIQ